MFPPVYILVFPCEIPGFFSHHSHKSLRTTSYFILLPYLLFLQRHRHLHHAIESHPRTRRHIGLHRLALSTPSWVKYTEVSAPDISESILLAAPGLNETAVAFTDSHDGDLTKRANHGAYLCVDASSSEYCFHIVATAGVCDKYPWAIR